jgi:hypothetical protein
VHRVRHRARRPPLSDVVLGVASGMALIVLLVRAAIQTTFDALGKR